MKKNVRCGGLNVAVKLEGNVKTTLAAVSHLNGKIKSFEDSYFSNKNVRNAMEVII